jgi:quercetin dioxygenase-like cupin family protein
MKAFKKCMRFIALFSIAMFVLLQVTSSYTSSDTTSGKTGQDRVAFSHPLPTLDGSRLKVTIVEVTYGAGESSPPHSHPCPVIGYVIDGVLRTQVKGESEHIYHAGESFYEAPNGIHQVSANASQTAPVRFLAYFVCDHEVPLSVAPPKSASAERR